MATRAGLANLLLTVRGSATRGPGFGLSVYILGALVWAIIVAIVIGAL